VPGAGDQSQKQKKMCKYQTLRRVFRSTNANHAPSTSNHEVDGGAQLVSQGVANAHDIANLQAITTPQALYWEQINEC
jgi:hypothetical protein